MSAGRVETRGLLGSLLRTLLALVLVAAVVLVAAGWYFADQLTAPPTVRPFGPGSTDTVVVTADEDSVTLMRTPDLETGGRFGLQLPDDGYASLGQLVADDGGRITYEVVEYDGDVPAQGTPARVDEFWRVGTPRTVGLQHEDVLVPGQLGDMAAWWVPSGDRGTVVYVHGRGATREEALRFLPGIARAGWSTLVITYRGDEGAPALRDGRLRYGVEEWADVESALGWVGDTVGTDRPVVLYGSSMGGAVVAQFLDRSSLETEVDGVLLDSPVVSLDDTLDLQADLAGVPEVVEPVLLPVAQWLASLLYGLETDTLEQTADDGTFDVPTLVFHGSRDDFVPWTQSLQLAERNATVTHVGVEGARHVRSWNVDSDSYERRVVEFLQGLA